MEPTINAPTMSIISVDPSAPLDRHFRIARERLRRRRQHEPDDAVRRRPRPLHIPLGQEQAVGFGEAKRRRGRLGDGLALLGTRCANGLPDEYD